MSKGSIGLRACVLAGLCAATATAGCSFLVYNADDKVQCNTDNDCKAKGAVFANTTCTPEHICVSLAEQKFCTNNDYCVSHNGGLPYICKNPGPAGVCVAVLSKDCTALIPARATITNNTVLFGYASTYTGTDPGDEPAARISQHIIELALGEFKANAVGLPGGAGNPRNQLVGVQCDESQDVDRPYSHLANDLGIAAIINSSYTSTTVQASTDVLTTAGTYLMASQSGGPLIDTLDTGPVRLVWRPVSSLVDGAIPQAALVPRVEAKVRAAQSIPAGTPIRVAFVVEKSTTAQLMAEKIQTALKFNGKSIAANGADFLRTDYDDVAENPTADFTPTIAAVVAFKPHIILNAGGNSFNAQIATGIESNWPTTQPKPEYVLTAMNLVASAVDTWGLDEATRTRVIGVYLQNAPEGAENLASFGIRYKAAFPDPADDASGFEGVYDGMYSMMYAMVAAAAANPKLTGSAVALAMPRQLPPGAPVNVGPTDLALGFSTMSSGSGIDLLGTITTFDYDLKTGTAPEGITTWCITKGADGKYALLSTGSGETWDKTNQKFVGTYSCP